MDISRYLRENDNDEVRQEHLERLLAGKEVWNAWAEDVLATLLVNGHDAEEYIINLSSQDFKSSKVVELDFSNYIFPLPVSFEGSVFTFPCTFRSSVFKFDARFMYCSFSSHVDFDSSSFQGNADFRMCEFFGKTFFMATEFLSGAYFSSCRFGGIVSFSQAKLIKNSVIDFRQTVFNNMPLLDQFFVDDLHASFFNLENSSKFRALKQIAQANNNHWLEVQYQALELRCARALSSDSLTFLQRIQHLWRHFPNYAFDWLSGYGVSIKKPIRAWLLVTVLCCLVQYGSVKNKVAPYYHFCSTSLVCKVSDRSNTTPVSWNEALQFHFSPSIPSFLNDNFYLKELRQNYYKDGRIPALSRFVRLIQSLMTYVCLFLVGLALRNRFKL